MIYFKRQLLIFSCGSALLLGAWAVPTVVEALKSERVQSIKPSVPKAIAYRVGALERSVKQLDDLAKD